MAGPSSHGLDGPALTTNGHTLPSLSTTNGHSATNGVSANGLQKHGKGVVPRVHIPGTLLHDDMTIDREEFVRLVVQSLRDVGYTTSAHILEQESGYTMEGEDVSQFRQSIMEGEWTVAESMLTRLGVTDTDGLMDAKFLINQQKYLELLEAQRTTEALHVLRNQLAPLGVDPEQLHSLSSLIMCSEPEDVRQRAGWDGAAGNSRDQLLLNLHHYIPSSIMIPQRRMPNLLQQSRLYQRQQCLYHNLPSSNTDFSLYNDHRCDKSAFPRVTTTILKGHKDEVWHIEWSHDGAYLASASKDKAAIIWKIGPETEPSTRQWETHHILRDHPYSVGCLAWSLDDTILLTSADNIIKIWNTKTGVCLRPLDKHTETVTSLAWLPNGSGFLSAGLDRRIIHWDVDGTEIESWGTTAIRITSLAVTPDMSRVVTVGMHYISNGSSGSTSRGSGRRSGDFSATPPTGGNGVPVHPRSTSDNWLITYTFATKQVETSVRLEGEVTSVKVSQNSQYALINHAPDEIHLWDLNLGRVARKFTGQKQGRHVIRSCFGGWTETLSSAGVKRWIDGNVYVWHRETGVLLEVLSGHGEGSVNSVAWNPRKERMFASCSDDHTIRIWEALGADLSTYSQPGTPVGKGKGKIHQH
ncbi:WD40 repeat-like protein [Hymenopellis radicata]|nr:WD40 repeat-like protein [Hymenopellis radicata]